MRSVVVSALTFAEIWSACPRSYRAPGASRRPRRPFCTVLATPTPTCFAVPPSPYACALCKILTIRTLPPSNVCIRLDSCNGMSMLQAGEESFGATSCVVATAASCRLHEVAKRSLREFIVHPLMGKVPLSRVDAVDVRCSVSIYSSSDCIQGTLTTVRSQNGSRIFQCEVYSPTFCRAAVVMLGLAAVSSMQHICGRTAHNMRDIYVVRPICAQHSAWLMSLLVQPRW